MIGTPAFVYRKYSDRVCFRRHVKIYCGGMMGIVAFVLLVFAIFGLMQKFGSNPNPVNNFLVALVVAVVVTLVANK